VSKKKRKKRPGSTSRPAGAKPRSGATARRPTGQRSAATSSSGRPARTPWWKRPPARPGVPLITQPPAGLSIARGLAAVGGSPALLASVFLGVLALWFLYSSYAGILAPSPAAMVLLVSLPPVHSLLDIQLLASGHVASATATVAFGAGLLILRALLVTVWVSLALDRLGGHEESFGRPSLGGALRRFGNILVVEAGLMGVAVGSLVIASGFLGASLGALGVIGALIGGLYFLVYTPVAVVADGLTVRAAVRASIRAARIPGPRHMLIVFGYLAVTLFMSVSTPGSRVAQATPSFMVWALVLFVSFLHVAVLGSFVYRWLALREPVLAERSTGRAEAAERRSLR
jgi:hypothetical protein